MSDAESGRREEGATKPDLAAAPTRLNGRKQRPRTRNHTPAASARAAQSREHSLQVLQAGKRGGLGGPGAVPR